MRKKLIDEVSRTLKISRNDMVEKDIIIHEILTDLSHDEYFSNNFIFKGGTCLIKGYLGYYRFSEDMDFTWKNQDVYQGKSGKKINSELSKLIDKIGKLFEKIASTRNLDFKCEKSNRDYVELGGSNKICTFKLLYNSEVLKQKSFVKVQINFVEKLFYSSKKRKLQSLVPKDNEELKSILSDEHEYIKSIDFETYEPKEILCEKIRAILTRKGIKARDFLDAYLICKQLEIELSEIEDNVVEKLRFSLEMYDKYRENFKEKIKTVESGNIFEWGEEKYLLLKDVDEKDFYSFIEKIKEFLKIIIQKINSP